MYEDANVFISSVKICAICTVRQIKGRRINQDSQKRNTMKLLKIIQFWLRKCVKIAIYVKYSFAKFTNFVYTCITCGICSHIQLKSGKISTRNTKNIHKICKLRKSIFSVFYNISQPNFGIFLILKGSFLEFCFFAKSKNLSMVQIVHCFIRLPALSRSGQ